MRNFSIPKELIYLKLNIGENIKFYRKSQDITQGKPCGNARCFLPVCFPMGVGYLLP